MTETEEIVEGGPLTSFGEEVKAAVEENWLDKYREGGRRRGCFVRTRTAAGTRK